MKVDLYHKEGELTSTFKLRYLNGRLFVPNALVFCCTCLHVLCYVHSLHMLIPYSIVPSSMCDLLYILYSYAPCALLYYAKCAPVLIDHDAPYRSICTCLCCLNYPQIFDQQNSAQRTIFIWLVQLIFAPIVPYLIIDIIPAY